MSTATKQWEVQKSDFKKISYSKDNSQHIYNYNSKYKDLYGFFKSAREKYPEKHQELIKTISRSIVEEISNIIKHNKTWNKMKVRTTINSSRKRFEVCIKYDGTEYYDPAKHNINNVVGSVSLFKYKRDMSINKDNCCVEINIDISLKD